MIRVIVLSKLNRITERERERKEKPDIQVECCKKGIKSIKLRQKD